jgi:cell wall-associated NlpC family hydrolase
MLVVVAVSLTVFASSAFADYYSSGQVLYSGMTGTEVANLQKDLKTLGYFGQQPTGYFGIITKQSVISYQKSKFLTMDGIVGRATARAIKVDKVLQTAKQLQGVPYVWGGTTPSGFDCSGFVQYVMRQNNVPISRTAETQYNEGTWVSKSQLKPGDIVFFTTYKPGPSHVGIYMGNNQFIHASSGQGKIVISDLSNVYYSQHYIGAKRVIP